MVAVGLQQLLPEASRELCLLLDPAGGPSLPPLRSEIFGPQRFAQHGRSLGLTHDAGSGRTASARFFPRLRGNIAMLCQAHAYIASQAATGYEISPAAEWLLDNFHLIEAQLEAIHEGLPRSYFRRLPVLLDEPLAGLPRIYGVAWAFVAHTDSAFDEDLLTAYLQAYQQSRELQLGEMWALPTTLRVVLIENLRRLAERVATHKAAREVANLCCDRIPGWTGPALAHVHQLLQARGVGDAFLAQVWQRLHERDPGQDGESALPASVSAWLLSMLPDAPLLQRQQTADQTADNLSVSNAVGSLRAIGDADWSSLVAACSPLMQLMLGSSLFAAEHSNTRQRTLHGIEALARRCGQSELTVARALLGLMQGATPRPSCETLASAPTRAWTADVAAYWLQGAGLTALSHALGRSEGLLQAGRRLWPRIALPAYLLAVLGGSMALVAAILHPGAPAQSWAWLVPVALLMLLPASEAMVAVIHRLIAESARPQHVPRLALRDGLAPEQAVMVAIPALLVSVEETCRLVHRLHLHALANPEPLAQFALLTDWADAPQAKAAGDAELLVSATAQVEALNRDWPAEPGRPNRFILLHRERCYSVGEGCWMGWERKRGKLEQLVAALSGTDTPAFVDLGAVSAIAPGTAYLLTLDADTQLPPGVLRALLGVAAHPLNQPRLSADGRRVVAGYGVLQPHLVAPLPTGASRTPFHWLFAGLCGIDPYGAASSEVYQDLFGEGSFTGKGLLHVQAAHSVLARRLPEDRVLSHDLLEGALLRCAAVTDISLVEDVPSHPDVAASRQHRWTRGDWQLLPFLLQPARWPMSGVNRWKLFDNLRRSMVAPASLALLVLALADGAIAPLAALALVGAAFAAGPLLGALAGFVSGRDHLARRHFYRQAVMAALRAGAGGLWHLATLLQQAMRAMNAILRTLWRLLVSHRHLLQWTTAAAAQAAAPGTLLGAWRRHRAVTAVALGLWGGLWLAGGPHPAWTAVLCALWAATPLWSWWASRPRPESEGLPPEEQAYLHGVARDTWRFFERCVTADDRHLPPDNLQSTPHEMLAHRTSPTNIGLYLLSTACARQFGWIGTPELLARLQATLVSVMQLQRYRGHLLNWYDTQSGAPLLPMYVSTVDSGNLSGHLLAVAQACDERAADPLERVHASALLGLARDCRDMAWQPDFNFLYHPKRHLLHIGYRVAEAELDAGFYDLLASESRLTSLLAIAKGDVPVRHWAALGRPFFGAGASAGLQSWAGSMFEYLMPTLMLAEPPGSVLHGAGVAALEEQRAHARRQGLPWGVSESAHAGRDHTLAYQYAPQGVPRLALRRTPSEERVVAPYATVLATLVAPVAAGRNLRRLQALGARGPRGFIEALDYSPARLSGGLAFTPVDTLMAHHQGMSIVALANVLLGGVVQRWGMADPHIEAVSSLLHERAPRAVAPLPALAAETRQQVAPAREPALQRQVLPGAQAVEPTHLLSNGLYSVALRPHGAGYSRRGAQGITRWRDDALRDEHGSFFYLRRSPGQPLVSLTQRPAPDPTASYRSVFHADRVCFDADWDDLHSHIRVWVSPEDDVEFRQVELYNRGSLTLALELVSAFDVTLADPRADEAHPAFSNLFVAAEWRAADQAMVFARRPRLAHEPALQAAHFVTDSQAQVLSWHGQADRAAWLGRNHSRGAPAGRLLPLPAAPLSTVLVLDTGLDPVCALGVRLHIAPGAKAVLCFATAAAPDDDRLRALVDKYRQTSQVQRASLMSSTLAGIRLRALGMGGAELAAIQVLSTALLLDLTRPAVGLPDAPCDRRLLWRLGLSGERPLLLVSAGALHGLGLLRSLSRALQLWAWGGLACDLVVVNAEPASYQMALQREIGNLRDRLDADTAELPAGERMGLHLLRADDLSADDLGTLRSLARVWLQADGRPLLHHVQAWSEWHDQALLARQDVPGVALTGPTPAVADAAAPVGRFAADSGEFSFSVSAGKRPPRPWINVLANPGFGCLVSESGGGCSWALNSRLHQLSAWSNDPVADTPPEWFVLQDLRSRQAWSVAPGAWADPALVYHISHGQGYTRIQHRRGDLEVQATWCVDAHSAVKQVQLLLVNHGPYRLRLRLTGMVEWLLGASRIERASVHTRCEPAEVDPRLPARQVLLATQRERAAGFGGSTAFLALSGAGDALQDWTCDRREFFDARGRLVLPDHLARSEGSGLDPCAALSTRFVLAADAATEHVFLLGHAASPVAARQLATAAAGVGAARRLQAVQQSWEPLLRATSVRTPDPLFDALVNRWLLYQAVSCRLWAKAAFYQAGGATGYRDQLQDTLALTWAAPRMLRDQILLCASRQYPAGDVQHWWHAPGGAGVRTHFSDDLLWLPHACLHYLRATADAALLDESVPFIEGPEIPEHAEDLYHTPAVSAQSASVFEHAARAIDRSLRVGAHGLPLMGSGDWNDGMNRVGDQGRGESVWLGWFLCHLVAGFAPLARARGEPGRARRWEEAAAGWQAALLGTAWDGQWYTRAYFDDGTPLGSHVNGEARIDLIAQAWAVLSGVAPPLRQRQALDAVQAHLVQSQMGLLQLLAPPLAQARPSAGYIQAYPPGVRENGGQYTHAGIWALMAQARLASGAQGDAADADRAWQWFTWLSPAHRAADPVHGALYGLEPYAVAADVYSQPPWIGRGGWSWYTGAAGWLHRAALESIFGLDLQATELSFRPCLPSHWPRAELTLRRDGRTMRFVLLRAPADRAQALAGPQRMGLLHIGERLPWPELAAESQFVVPLPGA